MGEFNSDDHYIYYCGQESLRRNGVAIIVNKRVRNAVLGCSLKNDRMISVFPRKTIQYYSNPSLCPDQEGWRSWSWKGLWRGTRPSKTNTPKIYPFHYRGLDCKGRESRNTWVTGKFGPGVQNEARQRLIEFCQENTLVITNTLFQQYKKRLYVWT